MKTSEVEIDITKLSSLKQFSSFLKAGTIEQLAKETGFICRNSSRLTGAAFLEMMVQHIAPDTEWSLADQCDYLWEQHGIELTKQSLDERYHTFTVSFLKSCYEAVFAQLFKAAIDAIDCSFSGIYLTDSTSFQLPAHLACFYQSNGGDTSGASVKLHQTIELLRFQIKDVLISDGKAADVRYWGKKGFEPEVGSLWIADLGHFSWDVFTRIAHSGSYFLSRYKTGTLLYIKDQEGGFAPLNIEQYVKSLAGQNRVHALEVYFGQEKVKARLICEAVPEEVKQQRLNKYRQLYARQSKGKGRHWEMTPTKERLSGYNLYITNAPAERIKQEDVFLIYGLRWQIELLFKIWKSLLFLDKVGQMNVFRFECFLYGRLIFILLSTELMSLIKNTLKDSETEVEISEWKTIKLIKKNSAAW
jgi:hypothetical protein